MTVPQPPLLNSAGAAVQISTFSNQANILPDSITITTTAAALVGATSLAVTITAPTTSTGAILKNGLLMLAGTPPNEQWIINDVDTPMTGTTLTVEPLKFPLPSGAIISTPAALPLIGLEGANLQLQSQVNNAVLLSNNGWQISDYSTGSWSFTGNLYIPKAPLYATPAQTVIQALLAKNAIYVQRILANGALFAGTAIVSNASDTVQGAAYATVNLTLTGSGQPVYRLLNLGQ